MKKALLLLVVVFGLVVGGAAVGRAAEDNGPIVIGAVIPLTGGLAKFGEMQKHSYDLALEEINQAGGVKGKKLELLIEDDTGRPEVGRSAVEKLISKDNIVVLTGGYSSSVTYAIAAWRKISKCPMLPTQAPRTKLRRWDRIMYSASIRRPVNISKACFPF